VTLSTTWTRCTSACSASTTSSIRSRTPWLAGGGNPRDGILSHAISAYGSFYVLARGVEGDTACRSSA
jgi:hypothetical protein